MNFKVTLVLLVLVLAGFAAFLWVDKQNANKPEDEPLLTPPRAGTELWPATARVGSERVSDVTIEISEKTIAFTRDASPSVASANDASPQPQWNQTKPVLFPVNGSRLNAMVSEVYGLRYTAKALPGIGGMPALEDAGLSPAVATVTLKDTSPAPTQPAPDSRTTMTLKLGKTSIGGRAYVMINDDPNIYVVGDEAHKVLIKPNFDDYRQSTLIAPAEGRAQRITLERIVAAKPYVVAMSKSEGKWAFDAPHAGRVDRDQIAAILSAVSSFSVSNFVSEDPSRLPIYGLDQPSIALTVVAPQPTGAKAATATAILRIGNSADLTRDNFYCTWSTTASPSPVVFVVPKSVVASFTKDADAFRDWRVAPLAASDVVDLRIEREGTPLGFVKSPEGWGFFPPNPLFPAEPSAVTKIVDALTSISAENFVDGAPKSVVKPDATIKISATGRAEPDVLRLYANAPEGKSKAYTAYLNNEATGYVVAAEKLAPVFVSATDVRGLKVLPFGPDVVTRVTLQQPGLASPLVFERAAPATPPGATQPSSAPGVWKLIGSDRFESSAFEVMLKSILPLKAEQWLTEPAALLAKGDVVITLQRGAAAPVTLTIDPATRRAAVSTDAAMFQISATAVVRTQEEFRDRTVIPIHGRDVTNITITDQSGKPTEIVRDEAAGFLAIDGQKIDTTAVGKIVDVLAGLRVERYRGGADRSAPIRTIAITTSKGDKLTLSLLASGTSAILAGKLAGTDIDRVFQLDAATLKTLSLPLTPKAEPKVEDM